MNLISGKNENSTIRNKITFLSFFCSILVIYVHTYNLDMYGITENSDGIANRLTYLIEHMGDHMTDLAVPMFFCLSGFLFFRTFLIERMTDKLISRFFSVVIPYLVWCTLYYLYNVILTSIPMIRAEMEDVGYVKLSLMVWLRWLWVDQYYTLWFLKNLIVYFALTPVIYFLLTNWNEKIPTGAIVLVGLIIAKILIKIEIPYTNDMEYYLVGSYLGINHKQVLEFRSKILTWLSVAIIVFMTITRFEFLNSITIIMVLMSSWFACDLIPLIYDEMPWWMSITFFTYVAHDGILEPLENIIHMLFQQRAVVALADYIFAPILVEYILIKVAYVLIKYMPKMWIVLNGGRSVKL